MCRLGLAAEKKIPGGRFLAMPRKTDDGQTLWFKITPQQSSYLFLRSSSRIIGFGANHRTRTSSLLPHRHLFITALPSGLPPLLRCVLPP